MKRIAAALFALALGGAAAPAQTAPPVQEPQAPQEDPRLVAIGGLGAGAMYFSFKLIDVTATAVEKGVYTADEVRPIVGSVAGVLKTNVEQLAAVQKVQLTPQDAASTAEMIAVMEQVVEYANLLGEYAKDKTPAAADTLNAHREKTWTRMKKLLGIQ